jgi:hypothetical protein
VGYGLVGFTTYDSRKWQPKFTRIKKKKGNKNHLMSTLKAPLLNNKLNSILSLLPGNL